MELALETLHLLLLLLLSKCWCLYIQGTFRVYLGNHTQSLKHFHSPQGWSLSQTKVMNNICLSIPGTWVDCSSLSKQLALMFTALSNLLIHKTLAYCTRSLEHSFMSPWYLVIYREFTNNISLQMYIALSNRMWYLAVLVREKNSYCIIHICWPTQSWVCYTGLLTILISLQSDIINDSLYNTIISICKSAYIFE